MPSACRCDAHSTNWAENQEFFLNQTTPTNFETDLEHSYYLYKRIGAVSEKTEFDQVMDFSVLKKLGNDTKYSSQKNEYDVQFAPATAAAIQGESDEILTKTVVIHFSSNSWDLTKKTSETINASLSRTLRSERAFRGGRDREDGRTVWSRAYRHRRPHGFIDEGPRTRRRSSGTLRESGECCKGSHPEEIPDAAAKPVHRVRSRLGSTCGSRRPLNQAKNRRVEVKVYPLETPK